MKTSVPVSGMDLWAALSATIGSDKAVALLQEQGFTGSTTTTAARTPGRVKDEHRGLRPHRHAAGPGRLRSPGALAATGHRHAPKAGQPTKLWQPIKGWSTPREQLRSARRLGAEGHDLH